MIICPKCQSGEVELSPEGEIDKCRSCHRQYLESIGGRLLPEVIGVSWTGSSEWGLGTVCPFPIECPFVRSWGDIRDPFQATIDHLRSVHKVKGTNAQLMDLVCRGTIDLEAAWYRPDGSPVWAPENRYWSKRAGKRETQGDDVYFVRSEGPETFFKIGHSSSLKNRLSSIQIGSPYPTLLYALIRNGGREREEYLHWRFDHLRVQGEWFRTDSELINYILDEAESP